MHAVRTWESTCSFDKNERYLLRRISRNVYKLMDFLEKDFTSIIYNFARTRLFCSRNDTARGYAGLFPRFYQCAQRDQYSISTRNPFIKLHTHTYRIKWPGSLARSLQRHSSFFLASARRIRIFVSR